MAARVLSPWKRLRSPRLIKLNQLGDIIRDREYVPIEIINVSTKAINQDIVLVGHVLKTMSDERILKILNAYSRNPAHKNNYL